MEWQTATDCWDSNLASLCLCFLICKMGVITIVPGNSLAVQEWLGLCAFTDKGPGSIPGQGIKVLPCGAGMERSCLPESENDGEWGGGARGPCGECRHLSGILRER